MKSLASAVVLEETKGRLRSLRVEDKALWGRMTAVQMVRHLCHSCEMALGDRHVEPVKGVPPAVLRWAALWSGIRWKKNYSTTPELELALKEDSGASFDELVVEAVEKIGIVADGTRLHPEHPMMGTMTTKDWMRWGYLHTDHHLRQFGR
jgi:hypothetical protein